MMKVEIPTADLLLAQFAEAARKGDIGVMEEVKDNPWFIVPNYMDFYGLLERISTGAHNQMRAMNILGFHTH